MRRSLTIAVLFSLMATGRSLGDASELSTVPAVRDSSWYGGHAYRQWIYDQNSIGDDNSNLDPGISFIENGRIRIHTDKVYFYENLDLGMRIARETGFPIAFYLFDHTCSTCLDALDELYNDPEIVLKSRGYVNIYVELPRHSKRVGHLGLMNSSLTVQFCLPSMRPLRVVTSANKAELLEAYRLVHEYWRQLTPEERLDVELEKKRDNPR